MKKMLDEFKSFALKGNLLDLAVAVIIGGAFGLVVKSFTEDVLMAILGAIVGKPNFDQLVLELGDGKVFYGKFLTQSVNFVFIAFAVFLVVKAANAVIAKREEEPAEPSDEVKLLTEIRDALANRG